MIFVASFAIMLYFDLIVTVCVIVAITIMFLVPGLMGGILEKRQSRFSQQLSAFTSTLKDILSGFEVIKTYSMKKYITCKFDGSNEGTANGKYSVDVITALNEGLSVFLALMVQVVVLFLSAYFIITDRITVGTMLGMVQVSSNLANPILMIFINIPKIKSARSITHKLKELSDYQTNQSQKKRISDLNHCISIKNLSFSYDGQTDILKNISCTIEKGKKYAILGKSGCGKSTLVKLLSGYYTGYEGKIFYDNTELKTLCKNDVAGLSSIIHQNIYMFDETIYDNICLHETYSQTRIDSAVSASGLSTFVSALPEGLSYKAGENGSNLSGGQKQRIAVARALIRNKPVLVLDEGTSAIDMQTAYDIETRLLKIKDLTMITITHSLNKELLAQYDTILYMEAGKISDSGSFTQLLGRNPGFAEYINVAESTEEKTTH